MKKITRYKLTDQEKITRDHKKKVDAKIKKMFPLINMKNSWCLKASAKYIYPDKALLKVGTDTARIAMVKRVFDIYYAMLVTSGSRPPSMFLLSPSGGLISLRINQIPCAGARFHIFASYYSKKDGYNNREVDTTKYKDSWWVNSLKYTLEHREDLEEAMIGRLQWSDRDLKGAVAIDLLERVKIKLSLEDVKHYLAGKDCR